MGPRQNAPRPAHVQAQARDARCPPSTHHATSHIHHAHPHIRPPPPIAATPLSKRLRTTNTSNILVFLSGHGGDEFFKFRDTEEMSTQVRGWTA